MFSYRKNQLPEERQKKTVTKQPHYRIGHSAAVSSAGYLSCFLCFSFIGCHVGVGLII
jgi:hypothetical protein